MTDEVYDQEVEIPKTYDESYIRRLRGECAKRRIELREVEAEKARLEAKIEAHERGEENPELVAARERLERAEQDLADLNREWEETQLKEKIQNEAKRLGAVDGDAVYKLMNLEADDLGREIRRVLDEHPYLRDPKSGPPMPLGRYEVTQADLDMLGDNSDLGH